MGDYGCWKKLAASRMPDMVALLMEKGLRFYEANEFATYALGRAFRRLSRVCRRLDLSEFDLWLRNYIIRKAKRHLGPKFVRLSDEIDLCSHSTVDPSDALARHEMRRAVNEATVHLPPKQRIAGDVLKGKLTCRKAARKARCAANTLKEHLRRATEKLRRELENWRRIAW